ncbi:MULTISPECIES: heme lyase NrfEFG subunit NrfF [Aliivibrio]|uniref:Formate-dependent nitrite reductase complex subunit n=1 Tax=Aliivibrio finisterrensis TaxID=511998 RepID=A0A4V1Z8W6_9GAMM|nr:MULTISPECIES: heme lyase NrfEFG subunit NrfF [Aliivibrio]MDD9177777.1 heme lyase NrfEFG subunit NrfF [Aliivibrio sp. A6]RYU50259.1 heme lyase NrfEFG subunit NrfF [Aliivibrio finisterrensis]RYU51874.1 heme lyase NrfEFG subunit NrfF [Aliivibrio finisterrensis]RYU55986.1 heme lyase NrfEFG subunit NrfF [Aliivibrio finisterrensis]RYU64729.1 heme lyase NrfEFG subunit NrfF [Aliivibrio finisterrensis]
MKQCKELLFLIIALFSSVSVQANSDNGSSLFVGADKEVIESVELFEFNSPQEQKRSIDLAKQLRCPQCQNQNLVESNSPIAKDLRLQVYQQIKAGKSDKEVVAFMTRRFGDFVLYEPPLNAKTYVLWLLPLLLLIGFGIMAVKSVNKNCKESS